MSGGTPPGMKITTGHFERSEKSTVLREISRHSPRNDKFIFRGEGMTISSEGYRDALRHFPAGVTLVTVKAPAFEEPYGLTVSAFASVSPKPPLILVAIDHRGKSHAILEEEGAVFAVNILGQDQQDLSNRFAWTKDEDRFALGDWDTAVTGAPILKNALAWLDCTIHARMTAGTHTIYIGEVQAGGVPRPDDAPLIYWNRGYRRLALADGQQHN